MREKDLLFYDGHCGLCHGTVRFLLAADREGARFDFAPLQGRTFQERVPEEKRRQLPDSLVFLTADGNLLVKSQAVLHILTSLGGGWRLLGAVGGLLPRAMRDGLYDVVARVRHRFFAKPADVCPVVPPALRGRFKA